MAKIGIQIDKSTSNLLKKRKITNRDTYNEVILRLLGRGST